MEQERCRCLSSATLRLNRPELQNKERGGSRSLGLARAAYDAETAARLQSPVAGARERRYDVRARVLRHLPSHSRHRIHSGSAMRMRTTQFPPRGLTAETRYSRRFNRRRTPVLRVEKRLCSVRRFRRIAGAVAGIATALTLLCPHLLRVLSSVLSSASSLPRSFTSDGHWLLARRDPGWRYHADSASRSSRSI